MSGFLLLSYKNVIIYTIVYLGEEIIVTIKGAEEYLLRGGTKGVLLIHGFTGSPAELRPLGDYLNKQGYTVLGVLLPGHGTVPEDLNNTAWEDWYAKVTEGFKRLQQTSSSIYVVGMSMGGLLAMKAAAELPVAKAVFMSTPIFLYDRRAKLLWFAKYFLNVIRKGKRNYDIAEQYNISYNVMPIKGIVEVCDLIKHCVHDVVHKITVPCLIMQSKVEHTVRPKSANYIYDNLQSEWKKISWFERSGHIITLDRERARVHQEIDEFLRSKENEGTKSL